MRVGAFISDSYVDRQSPAIGRSGDFVTLQSPLLCRASRYTSTVGEARRSPVLSKHSPRDGSKDRPHGQWPLVASNGNMPS